MSLRTIWPGLFSWVVIHTGDLVAAEAIPLIHSLKAQDVVLVIGQIPAQLGLCALESCRYKSASVSKSYIVKAKEINHRESHVDYDMEVIDPVQIRRMLS